MNENVPPQPARLSARQPLAADAVLAPLPPAYVERPEPGGEFALRDYWRVLSRHRWSLLGALVPWLLGAVLVNGLQQPVYLASATLRIDREPSGAELHNTQRLPEPPDYIETQYRILESRSLARAVIVRLQLAARSEFRSDLPGGDTRQAPLTKGHSREDLIPPAIVDAFLERLVIDPGKGTRLVTVSFISADRDLAPAVANTLAREYIEYDIEAKSRTARKSSAWLRRELSSLRTALEASETVLREYAARHSLVFLDESKETTRERLAALEAKLTEAETDRIGKESLALSVGDLAAGGEPLPGHLDNRSYQDLRADRTALQKRRAELSVTFGPGYPAVRRAERQLAQVEDALALEGERILSGVGEAYLLAQRREARLRQAVGRQRDRVHQLGEHLTQYHLLEREAETSRVLYQDMLQRLKEIGASAGLRRSNVTLLDPAETPQAARRPKAWLNLLLGAIGGLLTGMILAFLLEHFETAVRSPEEAERLTGLRSLALIPRTRGKKNRRISSSAAPPEPLCGILNLRPASAESWAVSERGSLAPGSVRGGACAEAYRILRSALLLESEPSRRRILITACSPEEEQGTVGLNLAGILARLDRRVLLVDADMRQPSARARKGLGEYLRGLADLNEVITETGTTGLSLIDRGCAPEEASDLFHSERLALLLEECALRYEHVIVETPPALTLSDARTIAPMMDGVILVISARTGRDALVRTRQVLDRAGARFLGFVMTGMDFGRLECGYWHGREKQRAGESAA